MAAVISLEPRVEADKQAKQTPASVGVTERFSVSSTQNVSRQPPQETGLRLELWLQTLNTNMNEDLASFAADTARPQFRSKIMTRRASLIYLGRDSEAFDTISTTKSDIPGGEETNSTGTPARDKTLDSRYQSAPSISSHASVPDSPGLGVVGAAVHQGRLRRGSICVQSEDNMLGTLKAGQQYMGLLGLDRLGRNSRMCSTSLDMSPAGQQPAPVRTSQRLRATVLNESDFVDKSNGARRTKSTADIPNYSPPAINGSTRVGVRTSRLDSSHSSPAKQPSCLKQTSTLPTACRQGCSETPRNSGQQARFASELTPCRTDFLRPSATTPLPAPRPLLEGFSRASVPISTPILLSYESSSNSSISAPHDCPAVDPGSPQAEPRAPNTTYACESTADLQEKPLQQQLPSLSSAPQQTAACGERQLAVIDDSQSVQASDTWLTKLTAAFKALLSCSVCTSSTSCDPSPHPAPARAPHATSSRQRWYEKADGAEEADNNNLVQPFN